MKCEIIRDLLPLYMDNCCSDASRKEVETHLQTCKSCHSLWKNLSENSDIEQSTALNVKEIPPCRQLSIWKASVLQSVLFLFSFLLIIIGVAKEAATGYNTPSDNIWFFNLIIPATAFMLTMVNWYFVRFYRSKKSFSAACSIIFIAIYLIACIWGLGHYECMNDLPLIIKSIRNYLPGIIIAIVFIGISNRTAVLYSKFMGKF